MLEGGCRAVGPRLTFRRGNQERLTCDATVPTLTPEQSEKSSQGRGDILKGCKPASRRRYFRRRSRSRRSIATAGVSSLGP